MRSTPKSLAEAIRNGLANPMHRIMDETHHEIQDFIAQKFQVAMLKTPLSAEGISELYEKIIAREKL